MWIMNDAYFIFTVVYCAYMFENWARKVVNYLGYVELIFAIFQQTVDIPTWVNNNCMPRFFANNDVDIICHLSCERKYWLCRFRDLSPTQQLVHFDIGTRSLVNYNHRSASKVRSLGLGQSGGSVVKKILFRNSKKNTTGKLLSLNTPTESTF